MRLSAEELRTECSLKEYLLKLRGFAGRYCVMLAASDTPWGPAFTQEYSCMLTGIGTRIDLYGQFRMAYVAVINEGELIYEELSQNPIEKEIELDGHRIELLSVGFDMERSNAAKLSVDGRASRSIYRGLNFYVVDLVTGVVIDDVNFDTYAPSFPYKRIYEEETKLKSFLQKHPGVSLCTFNVLPFPTEQLTENEQFIRKYAISRAHIVQNIDTFSSALEQYYKKEEIPELFVVPSSYHGADGVRQFEDHRGCGVNILGGHRVTSDQPALRKRTIYLVGGCRVFGIGTKDRDTIASYLQRMLNERFQDEGFVVQNYGFFLAELDSQSGEELAIISALPLRPGDIILYLSGGVEGIPHLDTTNNSGRIGIEIFYDQMHFTPDGNRLMAEGLLNELDEKGILTANGEARGEQYGFAQDRVKELQEYKRILSDTYEEMFGITVGSIVMNANPFTLGHRYLVEEALKQCDFLVVFVVQEDQSEFSFDERLEMVDEGLCDLQNVLVVPSGSFIISSLTFKEYFNKSELQDRVIDPTLDVRVFAKEIAPCMHITKRFAGTEPLDAVTGQYNDAMAKILPEYGIEFIEIPRYEKNGKIISASQVRKFLHEGKTEELRSCVPASTYEYLMMQRGRD